jgi:hypothetical protein
MAIDRENAVCVQTRGDYCVVAVGVISPAGRLWETPSPSLTRILEAAGLVKLPLTRQAAPHILSRR